MKNNKCTLLCAIMLILISGLTGGSTAFAQTWTSIDGGGTSGINTIAAATSIAPSVVVYNGSLYAIWCEMVSSKGQIHIKKYNGSTWVDAGTSGSQLDISTTGAENPKLASYNGYLYAAWQEYDNGIYNIHVKQYNGSTWTFTQSYTVGDGRININHGTTANSQSVDILVFNNELYATWIEQSPLWQLRVAKFDGSYWSNIDGNGTNGLNYNTGYDAYLPRLGTYNNSLYLTWTETNSSGVKQLRVKRYDGSSVWTLIGGGANGLNYDVAQSPEAPILVSYNNYLYLFWDEYDNTTALKYKVRVKRYNGTSWATDPDGGYGWHFNAAKTTMQPSAYANNNLLYVSWEENKSPYQIRIVSFDGTTKTFIDGNDVSGINQDIAMRAHNPELIIKTGDLYAVWNEDNGGSDNAQQIRAKRYPLPPIVESVSVPTNATYMTGQTLSFTVNYSKNVVISSGSPYIPITLNTGGTVNATYTGGSGTSTLTFSYTIVSGNGDPDGITVGTTIAGATLQSQDASPLTANLTLKSVGSTTGVLIDAVGPTVTSVSSPVADGYYNAGDVINITITCSEAATVTGTPTLVLNSGGTASYASGSGSTVLTFSYTVASGHNSVDLDYSTTNALSLAGGTIKDATGNDATLTLPTVGGANSLGGQKNIVIDNTAPTTSISSTATDPTNASIPITITFSESVTGFVVGDISVTNGTAGSFTTVNAYTYTASITPTAAGTVTINIAGSVATDAAGNNNTAATALTRVFDNVAPTVALSSSATDPTNASIPITITFSESVTGFVVGDISVTNGTAGSFATVNASTYTASITPTAVGTVTVNIAGSVATDAAGNNNTVATALTRVYDNVVPTVLLTTTASNPTNVSPIPVTITFSEAVTGFVVGDISVTNGTAGNFTTVNAYTYTASITPTAAGSVIVNIAGSVAADAAGNNNTAATALTRVYDNVVPSVSITSSTTDPTNTSPIPVTITFSEAVTGFVVGDISISNGTVGSFSTVNAYTYTASITPTAAGMVTVNIAGSVAADAAGNNNTAATAFTRVYDNVAPTVTLSSTATDPTNASIPVTITFSESVTGFVAGDISVTNGTAGSFSTVNASTYTANITPTTAGTVTVNIAGSVASDAAGNNNTAATALTRVYDNVAPTVTLSSTATNPTNASIPVTITFSESVSGFVVGDISVTNGTAGSFTTVNAYTYTASITPTSAGTVTVNIAGSVATDAAGNNNTAATALTRVYDNVVPTVTITSSATDPTNASTIPVTITFSEAVTGFVVGDISVTNGTAGSFSTVNAYTYTASITPTANGTVTVNVAGSVATDAAGNNNTAAIALTRVYDNVAPTLSISTTVSNPTNASPIPVTITFSESVSGFVVGDVAVTNGTLNGFSGGGMTYTVNVTPSGQGAVTVNVAAGVASDAAGNGNAMATQLSRTYDGIAPSVTLSSTTPDPTNTNPISINIAFSEAVTGFDVSDITVGNATASNLQTIDNINWTADISADHMGAFSVEILVGVAQDLAGNGNTASAYFQRTYDPVSPTVTLSSTSPNPTKDNPIVVNITLSESSWDLLDITDIVVSNGTASNLQLLGSGYHENWTVDIYPAIDGLVTVNIPAGVVHDYAANSNIAAAQFSRTCDITSPTVVISSTSGNPTNVSPIPVTITFNESVTGFAVGDITVTNGTVGNFSGSGTTYTLDVTPSGEGLVTVEVGAGAAQDAVGNESKAATQFSRTYIFPAINFTATSQSSVGESGSMTITAQLSAASISNVTVPFTVNSSSTATGGGIDYSIMASPITIVKGNTIGTIIITITPDALDENDETIVVDLGTPTNATLGASTSHTATITDDDETPVVTALQDFTIDENSISGTIVGTVVATDSDAGTTFSNWTITSNVNPDGDGTNAFAINATTGQIIVADAGDLDREANSSSVIKVTVSDGVNTSVEESVTINLNDVNDLVPVITASQVLHVTEQSPNGTTVGTVEATDGDVTATTFQNWTITAGNNNGYFAINASTGVVTVADNTGLNSNVNPSFTLTLTVSDGTNTSSSQTVLIIVAAVNDENPVITASQSFSIDENSANSAVVGTVLATDPDYGTVFQNWNITAGNTSNAFAINSSGEITINNSSMLDYESVSSFSLTIQVSDGIHTASGVVTINLNNLNDNSPTITGTTFTIDENSASGMSVGAVVATDADGSLNNLTYSIVSGNTNGAFAINTTSGVLTVNSSSVLDYEGVSSFSLIIQVSDGVHTGSGTATINLNNLNDNSPAVADATFAIDENSANGTNVGTVVATDADGTLNSLTYSIASGNANGAFAINSSSGAITVNSTQALDFETTPVFNLAVTVSDGTYSNNANVIINLNDLVEVGIDDNNSFTYKVYPNPAVDKVNIFFDKPSSELYTIEIVRLDGVLIYQSKEENLTGIKTIDLPGIVCGVYFIKIYNQKFMHTDELIVK